MIFLDTSTVYALADKADPNHVAACTKFDLNQIGRVDQRDRTGHINEGGKEL
jgi:predicted nucleic acid-binding protein